MPGTNIAPSLLERPLDPLGPPKPQPLNPPRPLPLGPAHVEKINFYLRMMMAISKAGNTCSLQQLADAATTELNALMESGIYNAWNTEALKGDLADIKKYVDELNNLPSGSSSEAREKLQQKISEAQSKFSADQTSAQSDENQADQAVQSAQTQTGQMSGFLQQIAQLASACNQIVSYLSNVLSR